VFIINRAETLANIEDILYIKATLVSVCVGSAWKILPVTARGIFLKKKKENK
jgi:hypothetical protein